MRKETIGALIGKIKALYEIEVAKKLEGMKVDENKDRLRIIFEFEFTKEFSEHHDKDINVIKDAVEIRHRRPWE